MSLPHPAPTSMVLVTGAANGIGRDLAGQLAARGYNLLLVDRDHEGVNTVAGDLRSSDGISVDVVTCNLTIKRHRERLIRRVLSHDLELVGLCNNAGVITVGKFQELPYEAEAAELAINAVALHHLTGALVGLLVARGSGAILNVTSLAANQPLPFGATYSATKAFAHTFSEALSEDLRGTGVSCTSLQPWMTRTHITDAAGLESEAHVIPGFVWANSAEVARVGIDAMVRGRRTAVPGLGYRTVFVGLGRHIPRVVWLPAVRVAGEAAQRRQSRVTA